MRNKLKLFGIIAAVAVIGLSVTGCGDGANGGGGGGGGGVPSELLGTWNSIENPGDTMVINSNGTIQETQGGVTRTITFSVSGSNITFTAGGFTISGTWSISGGILTLNWGSVFGTETFQRPDNGGGIGGGNFTVGFNAAGGKPATRQPERDKRRFRHGTDPRAHQRRPHL